MKKFSSDHFVATDINSIFASLLPHSGYSEGFVDTATGDFFYTRDHLGSIREVVEDDGSTVAARYDYGPYGRTEIIGTATQDASFRFTGHFYHAESGLHLAMYRAYDAALGRWISRDPLEDAELLPEGPGIYGYVGNNGINASDYLGLVTGIDGKEYISCGSVTRGSRIDSKFKNHPIEITRDEEFLFSDTRDIDGIPYPVHNFLIKFVKRRWLEDWTLWSVFQFCVEECDNGSFVTVKIEDTDKKDDSEWIILDR